jgi:hypothetical protein
MATQPLDVKNCQSKLDPRFAEFLTNGESRSVPLDNVKELRLGFTFSTNDNFDELERYLQLYAWPTNETPKRYVEDFDVRGVRVAGLWRLAFTTRIERLDERRQREFLLIVVLRRGFSEALDWTEALFMERRNTDGNGVDAEGITNTSSFDRAEILTVMFPNVAPDAIGTVVNAITPTVTGVAVQGVTLSDAWHRTVAFSRKEDDGTSSVMAVLSRNRFTVELYQSFGTPAQRTGYRIYDVPRALEHGIKEAWKSTGRSADSSLSMDRDTCVVTLWSSGEVDDDFTHLAGRNCAFFVQRRVVTEIAAIPEFPAAADGITYTSSFQLNQDTGNYSGWVEKRVRQSQTTGQYRSNNTHAQYVRTQDYTGLYPVDGGYEFVTLTVDDGEIVQSGAAITLPATVLDDGEIWQVSKRTNEDCTVDLTIRYFYAINQPAVDRSDAHLNKSTTNKNTQATAPLADIPAEDNQRITLQSAETEYGLWNTAMSIEEGKEVSVTNIALTGLSEQEVDVFYNAVKDNAVLLRAAGTTVSRTQEPSPYKDRWNISVAVEEGTPWDTDWITFATDNGTISVRAWDNQTLAYCEAIAATLTDATVNSFSPPQKNRFGRYGGTASTRLPDESGTGGYYRGFDEERNTHWERKRSDWVEPGETVKKLTAIRRPYQLWTRWAITKTALGAENDREELLRRYTSPTLEDGTTLNTNYNQFVEIVSGPEVSRKTDQAGRTGFLVMAVYRYWGDGATPEQVTAWVKDEPAPPAP